MNFLEIDPVLFEKEQDFFPLYDGLKPSQMGLLPFSKNKNHFLIGETFSEFRRNKEICRAERLSKYYRKTKKKYPEIVKFIINTLCEEYPQHFSKKYVNSVMTLKCSLTNEILSFNNDAELVSYESKLKFEDAFDALAMQVSEDLVVHDFGKAGRDFASWIHLCACNGWSAQENIGRGFDFIHQGVPRIKSIIPNTIKMMIFIASKLVSFERIAAISFKPNNILNRHPEFEKFYDVEFDTLNPQMYIRVERQTVKGFNVSNAFLFTIRTFIYDFNGPKLNAELREKCRQAIIDVFKNPPAKSYAYDIITKHKDNVLRWLNENR